MSDKRWGGLRSTAGYTATEAMTVVACMGVVAAFAAPNIIRMKAALEVQDATAQVGGALQRTRARAVSEATPYLFLVQNEEVGDGTRGAFALIVRDNDRSYSLTAPDTVETFSLEDSIRPEVRQFGESPDAAPSADIPPAYTDASKLVADARTDSSGRGSSGSGSSGSGSGSSGSGSGGGLLGGVGEIVGDLLGGGSSGSGSSGSGSSGSGSSGTTQTTTGSTTRESSGSLSDSVANGSTFPVSEGEGVPGVAFNERGIPVSLDSPNDWGTGAGAIYMSDGEGALYASVLSPLGEVSIAHFDSGSGTWK